MVYIQLRWVCWKISNWLQFTWVSLERGGGHKILGVTQATYWPRYIWEPLGLDDWTLGGAQPTKCVGHSGWKQEGEGWGAIDTFIFLPGNITRLTFISKLTYKIKSHIYDIYCLCLKIYGLYFDKYVKILWWEYCETTCAENEI